MKFTGNRPSMWPNIQNTSPFQKPLQTAQYTLTFMHNEFHQIFLPVQHNTISRDKVCSVQHLEEQNMCTVFMQGCCMSCCNDRLCTARLFNIKLQYKGTEKQQPIKKDCAMMPALFYSSSLTAHALSLSSLSYPIMFRSLL